jgi:polysaccharide pyruvyl transferase WcaK-like protein
MHHDFGYEVIDIHDRKALASAALKCKNILIGGGGLWGVDMNANTLLLSMFLFVSRWALRKKIYLLGVGYYGSTTKTGRLAAKLAGKAANLIIGRDSESVANFKCISQRVVDGSDIAMSIPKLTTKNYASDLGAMQQNIPIGDKTLMVAMRRPQSKRQRHDFLRYNKLIEWLVRSNPEHPIILVMLESEAKDPGLYEQARALRRKHKRLRIIEAPYNPLALYLYVRENSKRLALIAPQLHLIMTAHLTGVPFLPMTYDNKVSMLFDQIDVAKDSQKNIRDITGADLQAFADDFFGVKQK